MCDDGNCDPVYGSVIEDDAEQQATMYRDAKRKVGNQREVPTLTRLRDRDGLRFGGYQRFVLLADALDDLKSYLPKKTEYIRPYLEEEGVRSYCDVGCSNGALGFFAYHANPSLSITLYDHDAEYVEQVHKGIEFLGDNAKERMKCSVSDVRDVPDEQHDVVSVFALIHWIYSCTGTFGSLNDIVSFFSSRTAKHLVIEWIDPSDSAIRSFKHLDFNEEVHREAYNRKNFEAALHEHFPYVKKLGNTIVSREVWLASRVVQQNSIRSP